MTETYTGRIASSVSCTVPKESVRTPSMLMQSGSVIQKVEVFLYSNWYFLRAMSLVKIYTRDFSCSCMIGHILTQNV